MKTRSASRPTSWAIAAASLAVACGSGPEPPVAKLESGVDSVPLAYASSARLGVEWTPLRDLEPGVTPFLFVHLLDSAGNLHRAYDRSISPDLTRIGDDIEIWQSALADPLPPGSYRLTAGLYDSASGRRWRLETRGREVDEGEYEIAAVEVASAEPETPDLAFVGDWLAPEEGGLVNPGRRWMGKGGSIRLPSTVGWSELALTVSMIALPAEAHRPVFEDETTTPRLRIENGCDGGSQTRLEGYGVRSLSLRLDAPEGCLIRLEPNFVMLDVVDFTRRSVGLESAFFRPAAASGG